MPTRKTKKSAVSRQRQSTSKKAGKAAKKGSARPAAAGRKRSAAPPTPEGALRFTRAPKSLKLPAGTSTKAPIRPDVVRPRAMKLLAHEVKK